MGQGENSDECRALARLRIDPGRRTLGELLQDREWALAEILRLRQALERREWLEAVRRGETDDAKPMTPAATGGQLLRAAEVAQMVGMARSTIYRLISEEAFPRSVHVGPRAVRWRRADVEMWMEGLGK